MVKVTVLGASGGIGQPLSLLLKSSAYIDSLALYDLQLSKGIAADLAHVNTNSIIQGHAKDEIKDALLDTDVILVTAGIPRKPGMTRDDLFKINAGIVKSLMISIATYAPLNSRVLIISNPVNSTVPIAVETLKSIGKYTPGRVMGVTHLDTLRAQTFLLELLKNKRPASVIDEVKGKVTIVGGHSDSTIVPVLDKSMIKIVFGDNIGGEDDAGYKSYIRRIKFGGEEVVNAKEGTGSATLSMALAAFNFTQYILQDLKNEQDTSTPDPIRLSSYVYLPDLANGKQVQAKLKSLCGEETIEYFALPVILNHKRIRVDMSPLETLSKYELMLVQQAVKELSNNISKGKKFATAAHL